ncbi:hypothetical protein KAR91_66855 [Candidatus Pacearchaeota archaeon]|nr:hypothetical protein [Candidatus Pacearchaeota archaeon]
MDNFQRGGHCSGCGKKSPTGGHLRDCKWENVDPIHRMAEIEERIEELEKGERTIHHNPPIKYTPGKSTLLQNSLECAHEKWSYFFTRDPDNGWKDVRVECDACLATPKQGVQVNFRCGDKLVEVIPHW